jgi:sterol 24-C-methyltransferase
MGDLAVEGDIKRLTSFIKPESMSREAVAKNVDRYEDLYEKPGGSEEAAIQKRKENYTSLVNNFYDLVTSFYEYGWGQSFHFAPRKTWESFETSIHRHEMYLAHRIGLFKGMTALDVGCGVGGPARCIAVFSEGNVVGLNNNDYQISRARKITAEAGLSNQVSFLKADFMHIPVEDGTYDAVYAIEATCHAPDKVGCYSEVFRVLKPGCYFGLYEWVMTDKYNKTNPKHVEIKEGVEKGNGLPELDTWKDAENAMREAGFELIDSRDLAHSADEKTPWYLPLSGSLSISGWRHTKLGRWATHKMVGWMEWAHIAPKGTTEVSKILMDTADQLVAGGEQGIFTPMWFLLGRKPAKDE